MNHERQTVGDGSPKHLGTKVFDIDEELANALLDDVDIFNNKVKCRKIEEMMSKLMKKVEGEMRLL